MHFTVYGTLLSQGPLTALYNFDSGSAFYNLIVGPHRVSLNLYGFISSLLGCLSPHTVVFFNPECKHDLKVVAA